MNFFENVVHFEANQFTVNSEETAISNTNRHTKDIGCGFIDSQTRLLVHYVPFLKLLLVNGSFF